MKGSILIGEFIVFLSGLWRLCAEMKESSLSRSSSWRTQNQRPACSTLFGTMHCCVAFKLQVRINLNMTWRNKASNPSPALWTPHWCIQVTCCYPVCLCYQVKSRPWSWSDSSRRLLSGRWVYFSLARVLCNLAHIWKPHVACCDVHN